MGLFDFMKPKQSKVSHDIILTGMHSQAMSWAVTPFNQLQHLVDMPFRHEHLVAFAGMITCECYVFACNGIKNKAPDTDSVIKYIQNLAYLLEEDVEESSLFLQNNMIKYRQLFTDGMACQNMHNLCSAFVYDYTLLDGLNEQIDQLNETIQHQCALTTQSIAGLL